jgi:hypothetical protein
MKNALRTLGSALAAISIAWIAVAAASPAEAYDYDYGYTSDYGGGYDYDYGYTSDYGGGYDYDSGYTYDYGAGGYDYDYGYTYDYGAGGYDYDYGYTYDYGADSGYDYDYGYTYDYGADSGYDYDYGYTYDYGADSGYDYDYGYTYDYGSEDSSAYDYDYDYTYDYGAEDDYGYDYEDYGYDYEDYGYDYEDNYADYGYDYGDDYGDIGYDIRPVDYAPGRAPSFFDDFSGGCSGNCSRDREPIARCTGSSCDDDREPTCHGDCDDDCNGNDCDHDEDIQVECVASDSTIDEGDCVTYSVRVSGGDSPFDYDWSGDTEGEDDNERTIRVCYDDSGDYEVEVEVTDDDGDRDSDTCEIEVEDDSCNGDECDEDEDFDAECVQSDTRIEEGDSVTFRAEVDGGDSPFEYDWSGDANGDDRTITKRFTHEGTYTVDLEVTDDEGRRAEDSCTVRVEDEDSCSGSGCDDDEDFDVECRVSDSTIDEGDCVTYSVSVDGGDSPFEYDWNGDLEGERNDDERTIRVCYDDSGDYEVSVVVEDDDGNRESDTCEVEVDDDRHTVIDRDRPNGTLASIDSVYLSQIPYTGPGSTAALIAAALAVLGIGFGAAITLKKRSIRKQNSDRVAAFKANNLAKRAA